jgi:hypothetical protein
VGGFDEEKQHLRE